MKLIRNTPFYTSLVLLLFIGSSTEILIYKGMLDRFEDNDQAVVLLENINTTLIVPSRSLPVGSKVNIWFTIELKHDRYQIVSIDHETTENNARKSSDLMNELRKGRK